MTWCLDALENMYHGHFHSACPVLQVDDFELIPGGRNITVGGENKHEYVTHVAENWRTTAIRPQINAFMESFSE